MPVNIRKNLLARLVTPGGDDPLILTLVAPTVIRAGTAVSGLALVGQGGAGGYAYSLLTGSAYGSLPPGLSLNSSTGAITGTPTAQGHYLFFAQVQDSDSTVYVASFSITVSSSLIRKHKAVRPGEVFLPYTFTFMVVGNTGAVTWTIVSGSLPSGLSLDGSTGIVSGDPLADSSGLGGTSYFTLRATDAGSGDTLDLPTQIKIYEMLDFETFDIPDIIRGSSYSYTFPTRGGFPSKTFTLIGNPFTGLSKLKMNFNVSTGELSGTTGIAPGNYTVGLRVVDGLGAIRTLFDVLVVKNANTTIQPQFGGADIGDPGPTKINFEDGTGTTAEVTNVGGVVTVKFNSTGGGGGSGIDSINGAGPDSSGNIDFVSPDLSVGIAVNSAGQIQLTTAPESGGIQSINGATPDSFGEVTFVSGDASVAISVDSNGDIDLSATSGSSPLTTKGDIYTRDGSSDARLPVGSNGQVIIADSTAPTGLRYGYANAVLNDLATEILADSPTSYYKSDEPSGTTLVDSGSAGINLTIGSDATCGVSCLYPMSSDRFFSPSYLASGPNSGARASGNPAGISTYSGSWTVECVCYAWFSPTGAYETFFSVEDGTPATFNAYFGVANTGFVTVGWTSGGVFQQEGLPSFIRQHATHIVITKDATTKTLNFYFNGILQGVKTYPNECTASLATPVVFVGNTGAGQSLTRFSILGHVAFYYGQVLTYDRVIAHAKASGLFGL